MDWEFGKDTLRTLGALRPFVGGVFGLMTFFALKSGVVALDIVNSRQERLLLHPVRLRGRLQRAARAGHAARADGGSAAAKGKRAAQRAGRRRRRGAAAPAPEDTLEPGHDDRNGALRWRPLTPARRRKQYELLYESCLVRPNRRAAVDQLVAADHQDSRPRYEKVGKALGIPWYVVGIIHSLEASGNFTRHLHNGDPLTARTTHVPAGRPKTGKPPFTWEQSAIDALRGQGLAAWKDWSVPGTLFQLEGYNGFGYRDHHPTVPSPYLWSFSNHYTRGKYVADGHFSPTAVSQQCGAALLLKRLAGAKGIAAVAARARASCSSPIRTSPART